jgi:hypothetical protein
LVADSTKWPITNLDYVATFPKQIKEVFEEFTQMYEKSKRGKPTKAAEAQGKNPQSRAIILTWNVDYGECELQTYTLSDPNRELFVLSVTCMQGLLLLNFPSKESKKSAQELAKAIGMSGAKGVQKPLDSLVAAGVLKAVQNKFMINENFNSSPKLKQIALLPDPLELQNQDVVALEALNLGELASSGSGLTEAANSASNLQNKFMETLKYRIDARIVKHLKGRKAMKLSDLIELVISDLQM